MERWQCNFILLITIPLTFDLPFIVPLPNRRHFITVCLDAIASYKVELEATAGMQDVIRTMLARFKQLQAKLDRMLLGK